MNEAKLFQSKETLGQVGSVKDAPEPPKEGGWNYFNPDGSLNETAFFFFYCLRHPNDRTPDDWAFYKEVAPHLRDCTHQPSCRDRYTQYAKNSHQFETGHKEDI